MSLPRDPLAGDLLEVMLREFDAKDYDELMRKRTSTTEKVIKSVDIIEAPRQVQVTADQCKKFCEKVGLVYHPGYEDRVIERVTTTEDPDRYGDIVRAKGLNNINYRKNPVVLFAHMHGDFPVGKSIKEWIDQGIKGWRSWDLYLGDEVDTSGRSELTFRMILSGAMPGGSIGFIPVQLRSDHTSEEKEKMGLGKFGVEYLASEKLEHSACSVPANPAALSNSLKAVDSKRLREMFSIGDLDRMEKTSMLNGEMLDVFASVLDVKRTVSVPAKLAVQGPVDTESVEEAVVLRPYPNEHACRLADPGQFSEFRRGKREHEGKGYSVIFGKKKDAETWDEQAYRYPKDVWTEAEARSHCKSHEGVLFEPASDKEESIPARPEPFIMPPPAVNMTVNVDLSQAHKELCDISQSIKTFNGILDDLKKLTEESHKQLMAATSRALTALEQRMRTASFYDKREIEDTLRIPKKKQ